MGWCGEFGRWIDRGCDHAMVAGASACSCEHCATVCAGKFNGCKAVWAAGPVKRGSAPAIAISSGTPVPSPTGAPPPNGHQPESLDSRLFHLDSTMARMSDDLVALRRNLAGPHAGGADDDRLSRLEHGLDQMALDVAEALRLMRPVPQALQAHQGQVGLLNQRLNDLGQELSALHRFVTMQQATIDGLVATRVGSTTVPRPLPRPSRPDGPPRPVSG